MGDSKNEILFIGVGKPVPTFIRRRLIGLNTNGVGTVIVERGVSLQNQFSSGRHVHYHRLKGNIFERLKVILKFLSQWRFLSGLLISGKADFGTIGWRTIIEESQLVGQTAIAVIHSQWLMPAYRFNLFRRYYSQVPIIVSVRGSQLTVHSSKKESAELIMQNFEKADYIHCVSEDMRKRCISLGAKPEKLFVNYNGIDVLRFTPAPNRKEHSNMIHLISVGALIWRKGYIFQLQVIKALVDQGHSVKLTIIGTGADETALRYWAYRLGIEQHIIFEGQKPEDAVISSLQSADIYVSTSAAEGLPNSLVEAAAGGLPIVAFECEGAGEIIENEVSGFIVPFGSLHGMVDKILTLKDPNIRMKMGNYARQKMIREFDEGKWIGEMIERYKSIASI